jgi:hypothetical protein
VCQENKTQPKCIWTMDQGQSVLVHNMILWLVHFCIWYSNIMIAPYYQESVANEVLSTVGDVRFIKWAQDSLVSFVKCEPPSILHCGDKRYNAFKDVLAPICFFLCRQPGMAPQAKGYVRGPNKPAFENESDLEGKELSSQQKTKELEIDCIASIL